MVAHDKETYFYVEQAGRIHGAEVVLDSIRFDSPCAGTGCVGV